MNPTFIPYFFTPAEQTGLPSFKDDEALLNFLIDRKYLTVTDWKGEEEPFQIGHFIQGRLGNLKVDSIFEIENVYQLMQKQSGDLNTGDSVPFLLKQFQALVKKEGFTIVLLDRGNDSYYIGVAFTRHLKDLKKKSNDFWRWRAFGDSSGEVLYTVNCSCGSMNVWQVKRGEIITEDNCQNCGKEIFNKDGKSTFEIIREYV